MRKHPLGATTEQPDFFTQSQKQKPKPKQEQKADAERHRRRRTTEIGTLPSSKSNEIDEYAKIKRALYHRRFKFKTSVFASTSHRLDSSEEPSLELETPLSYVLLGSTGFGKSTTANFLSQSETFETSSDMEPCTRSVQEVSRTIRLDGDALIRILQPHDQRYKNLSLSVPIVVWDTPGLNESNLDQEWLNCQNVMKLFTSLRRVSMILICIQFGARLDGQLSNDLKYYQHFLKDFFLQGNWGIVITKIYESSFHDPGLDQYFEQVKNTLKDELGFRPRHLFFFNPEVDDQKYLLHNQRTRERMILETLLLPDRILPGMLFPLPPYFEEQRINQLNTIEQLKKIEMNFFSSIEEVKEGVSTFQQFLKLKKEKLEKIEMLRDQLQDFSQICPGTFLEEGGKSVIHFWSKMPIIYPFPYPNPIYKKSCHNCEAEIEYQEADNSLRIQLSPLFWTWTANALGYTWYFRLDIQWDGREINKTKIEQIEKDLRKIRKEVIKIRRMMRNHFFNFNVEKNQWFVEKAIHFNRLDFMSNKLSHKTFRHEEIESVFKLLKIKNYESADLKTLFPDFEENMAFSSELFSQPNRASSSSTTSTSSSSSSSSSSLLSSSSTTTATEATTTLTSSSPTTCESLTPSTTTILSSSSSQAQPVYL